MLQGQYRKISELKSNQNNARKRPLKQLQKLAANIKAIDFILPAIIDAQDMVLAGNGRLETAKMAIDFYQSIAVSEPNWKTANISLIGCSLGGGLAS